MRNRLDPYMEIGFPDGKIICAGIFETEDGTIVEVIRDGEKYFAYYNDDAGTLVRALYDYNGNTKTPGKNLRRRLNGSYKYAEKR